MITNFLTTMKKSLTLLLAFAFALCGKAQNTILQFADWFIYNQPGTYQHLENFSRNDGHIIRFSAHVNALPAGANVCPKKTIEDRCVTDDVLQVVLRRFKECADGAEQVWSSARPYGKGDRAEETIAISGYKGDLRFDLTTNGGRAFLPQHKEDVFSVLNYNSFDGPDYALRICTFGVTHDDVSPATKAAITPMDFAVIDTLLRKLSLPVAKECTFAPNDKSSATIPGRGETHATIYTYDRESVLNCLYQNWSQWRDEKKECTFSRTDRDFHIRTPHDVLIVSLQYGVILRAHTDSDEGLYVPLCWWF